MTDNQFAPDGIRHGMHPCRIHWLAGQSVPQAEKCVIRVEWIQWLTSVTPVNRMNEAYQNFFVCFIYN